MIKPTYEELAHRVKALDKLTSRHLLWQERMEMISDCFLSFTPDPVENINLVTALCGKILGATCALYNRIDNGKLISWGQWNTPIGYKSVDDPKGHLCTDVIQKCDNEIFCIRNLQQSRYAASDPNVKQYDLQTYVGVPARLGNECVGSLCVVFQKDFIPTEADESLMKVFSKAISIEEKRLHAEKQVAQAKQEWEQTFDALYDPVMILDEQFQIVKANKAMTESLSLSVEECIGKTCYELVHETKEPSSSCPHKQMLRDHKPHVAEVYEDRLGGDFLISVSPLTLKDGQSLRGIHVCHNITERKMMEKALREISIKDDLTGLLNRRGFFSLCSKQLTISDRSENEIFLLFADIDNMKWINDNLGHKEGDDVLKSSARILKDTFRDSDVIGRLGGDEFAVLLIDKLGVTDENSAITRLNENINLFNQQGEYNYILSISIGVERHNRSTPCNIENLLMRADKKMYANKKRKKDN